jgi:hypothetical protein
MTASQATLLAIAFVLILGISLLAQFGWKRDSAARAATIFLCGAGAVLALWAAGMPPAWLSGTTSGFGIAVAFTAGAFAYPRGEARAFGRPLLLGMGLTLLVANVVALASRTR